MSSSELNLQSAPPDFAEFSPHPTTPDSLRRFLHSLGTHKSDELATAPSPSFDRFRPGAAPPTDSASHRGPARLSLSPPTQKFNEPLCPFFPPTPPSFGPAPGLVSFPPTPPDQVHAKPLCYVKGLPLWLPFLLSIVAKSDALNLLR